MGVLLYRKKTASRKYVELVSSGSLVPNPEWFVDLNGFLSGDAASLLATSIYNVLADSRRGENLGLTGGLLQIIQDGGDAELWSLIRIALEEAGDDDFANICRERGFRVFRLEKTNPTERQLIADDAKGEGGDQIDPSITSPFRAPEN